MNSRRKVPPTTRVFLFAGQSSFPILRVAVSNGWTSRLVQLAATQGGRYPPRSRDSPRSCSTWTRTTSSPSQRARAWSNSRTATLSRARPPSVHQTQCLRNTTSKTNTKTKTFCTLKYNLNLNKNLKLSTSFGRCQLSLQLILANYFNCSLVWYLDLYCQLFCCWCFHQSQMFWYLRLCIVPLLYFGHWSLFNKDRR